jgi:hypothetical protein
MKELFMSQRKGRLWNVGTNEQKSKRVTDTDCYLLTHVDLWSKIFVIFFIFLPGNLTQNYGMFFQIPTGV